MPFDLSGVVIPGEAPQKPASKPAPKKKKQRFVLEFKTVSLTEKLTFTRHLGIMIKAGFSLTQALSVLGEQANSAYFKGVIANIEENVRRGKLFSEALAQHPKIFPDLYTSMVQVGEASGTLVDVLGILTTQLHKQHQLRSRVKGALMYPAVILTAMIGVGIFMFIFVIPKLTATLRALNVPLPFTTRLIIGTSDIIAHHTLLFLLTFALVVGGLVWWLRTPNAKRFMANVYLRLPLTRALVQKLNSAHIARTLGSLITSGVPLVQGFEITARTLANPLYREALEHIATVVPKGAKIQENLKAYPKLFPPLVAQMIGVGEETGALTDIMKDLAEFYEEEVDNVTKNLGSIIEPVLLIIMGVAVGFFVVSMITPMFSVYSGFSNS